MKRCIVCLAVILGLLFTSAALALVTIDGVQYDDTLEQSGAGWTWSPESKTLALNGFSGTGIAVSGIEKTTIELTGENSVSGDEMIVSIDGAADIRGSGTLRITGKYYGLKITDDLSIENVSIIADLPLGQSIWVTGVLSLKGANIDVSGAYPIAVGSVSAYDSVIKVSCKSGTAIASDNYRSSPAIRESTYTDCVISVDGGQNGISTIGLSPPQNYVFNGCDMTFSNIGQSCIFSDYVSMTDTKLTANDCGYDALNIKASDTSALTLNGGNTVEVYGARYAVNSPNFTFTDTDDLQLLGGECAYNGSAYLNGKLIENYKVYRLTVKNGVVSQTHGMNSANIGGTSLDDKDLLSDKKGDGWAWDSVGGRLTFNGYNGAAVEINGSPSIVVLGDNTITGKDVALYIKGAGEISGGGTLRLSAGDYALRLTEITSIENVSIIADAKYVINAEKNFTVKNSRLKLAATEDAVFVKGLMTLDGVYVEASGKTALTAISINARNSEIDITSSGGYAVVSAAVTDYYNGQKIGVFKDCVIRADGAYSGFITRYSSPDYPDFDFDGCEVYLTNIRSYGIKSMKIAMKDTRFDIDGCEKCAISVEKDITLKGGNVINAASLNYAVFTQKTYITSTDEVNLIAGEYAIDGSVYMDGAEIENKKLVRFNAKNGEAVFKNGMYSADIDGRSFTANELLSDKSGEGWSWNSDAGSLTLKNYNAGGMKITGAPLFFIEGENNINGDIEISVLNIGGAGNINVEGLIKANYLNVSGTGEINLSKYVRVQYDVRIDAGKLNAGSSAYGAALYVAGGEIYAKAISFDSITVSAGKCAGVFTGRDNSANIKMTGGVIESWGNMRLATLVMSGGTLRPYEENGIMNILAAEVNITGGNIALTGDEYAIIANSITIGGTANARLQAGVSVIYPRSAESFYQNICGEQIGVCTLLVIENGVITQAGFGNPALQVGEVWVDRKDIGKDFSGDGWKYDGKKKTLTLDGLKGDMSVSLDAKKIKLVLAPNSENEFYRLTFRDATGLRLAGASVTGQNSKLNCLIRAAGLSFNGVDHFSPSDDNNDLMYFKLVNSNYRCNEMKVKNNIQLKNSVLTVPGDIRCGGKVIANNSRIHGDIYAYDSMMYNLNKLSLKNSVLQTMSMTNIQRKAFPGSLTMRINDGYYEVLKSAKLSRSFSLPEGSYRVPEGVTLEVKDGESLRFDGPLVVEGTIIGDIYSTLKPEEMSIKGAQCVSGGYSIKLELVTKPASSRVNAVWSSSDEKAATVSQDGTVKGCLVNAPTDVTIKAVSDDGALSAVKKITVYPAIEKMTVYLDGEPISGSVTIEQSGEKENKLTVVFEPEGSYCDVVWKTSKRMVVDIHEGPRLGFWRKGKSKVTCKTVDGAAKVSFTVKVVAAAKDAQGDEKTKRVTDVIDIG